MTGPTNRSRVASRKRDVINVEYVAFMLRVTRRLRDRGCEDNGDIDVLRGLAALATEIDAATHDVVTTLRSFPSACSWAEIGDALEISRQRAQQRFRKSGGVRRPGGQPARWR